MENLEKGIVSEVKLLEVLCYTLRTLAVQDLCGAEVYHKTLNKMSEVIDSIEV